MDGTVMPYTVEDAPETSASGAKYTIGDDTSHAVALARVAQPTEFERAREGPQGGAASRLWSGIVSGAKAMNPFTVPETDAEKQAAIEQMKSPWKILGPGGEMAHSMAVGGKQAYDEARQAGQGIIPSVASGAAGAIGLDPQGIRERAESGDIAGVIGEGIPAVAATLAGGEAHRIPAAGKAVGGLLRTDEGELRPWVERGAKAGGAIAGAHIAGPIGAAAGYEAAPGFAERVIPKRAIPAEKPFVPQGPQIPKEIAGPGGIPVMSGQPLTLTSPNVEPEAAIQQPFEFPGQEAPPAKAAAQKEIPAMDKLEGQIAEAAGWKPLEPNVPLREQRQLQKPFGNRVAPEVSEAFGPRTVAPEKIPQAIPTAINEAMGIPTTPEEAERMRLQQLYPDSGERQLVHINGEKMYEATKGDNPLRKAITDLKAHDNKGGPDLARAMQNLGEDLGEKRIGNKKLMGEGQITREEVFNRLLDKGYSPQDILAAASEGLEPVGAGKPGPSRTSSGSEKRSKAGD